MWAKLVTHSEPLFPGDAEPELATLFAVSLADEALVDEVIATLQRTRQVQYAHVASERKGR